MQDARSTDDVARASRNRRRRARARDARWAMTLAVMTTIATATAGGRGRGTALARDGATWGRATATDGGAPVSYTHLTLPTILLV